MSRGFARCRQRRNGTQFRRDGFRGRSLDRGIDRACSGTSSLTSTEQYSIERKTFNSALYYQFMRLSQIVLTLQMHSSWASVIQESVSPPHRRKSPFSFALGWSVSSGGRRPLHQNLVHPQKESELTSSCEFVHFVWQTRTHNAQS